MANRSKLDELHDLWDALADYPASQTDAAMARLMTTLCGWLGADDALWIGAVRMTNGTGGQRDPQHGWRGRVVRRLKPPSPEIMAKTIQAMRTQDTDPGLTSRAIAKTAGAFRVHRLRDGFVDFAALKRTAHYRVFYREAQIADRLWAALPVNDDAESYFVFDHIGTSRRFSAADVGLVTHALRGIKWFHRQLLLSHGLLVAREPLSPVQREVLLGLLTGKARKAIAAALGKTEGTVHQYSLELYRKFGVRRRSELMALWLGQ
jgi:DNA-binding CsgD family transcriptional regulator